MYVTYYRKSLLQPTCFQVELGLLERYVDGVRLQEGLEQLHDALAAVTGRLVGRLVGWLVPSCFYASVVELVCMQGGGGLAKGTRGLLVLRLL